MSHQHDDLVVIPTLKQQLGLFAEEMAPSNGLTFHTAPKVDLGSYDSIIVCMSGGKDSIASLLHILNEGADPGSIELWHHDVDGMGASTLMDWPFMVSYNRKLAEAFNLPLYFSWLEGGLEGEMLKEDAFSKPQHVETPDGLVVLPRDTTRSIPNTRRRFPQQSASLATRWCSSVSKIDLGRRALNNQSRFEGQRVLFITGERREESSNRARYNQLEPHACDRRSGRKARHVDAWRPVLDYSEQQVWDTLRTGGVIAPVPYRIGWSRSSCLGCIFNHPTIWSTIAKYFPNKLEPIAAHEKDFGVTISRKSIPIMDIASSVKPLEIADLEALQQAMEHEYTLPVMCSPHAWLKPVGAFSKTACGAS